MYRLVWGCCLAVLVAGCSTSVPLSDVPVADGKVQGANGNAGATGAEVNKNSVAQVDLGKGGNQALVGSGPNVVYFDYDSYVIKPEFQTLIANQARLMKAQPARKVAVEGHTDETGGREYNLALGQKRAEAVTRALVILGVNAGQMEAVSFGKEKPADSGKGEAAYSKNRRAEIRLQ